MASTNVRQNILARARSIVVKMGSQLTTAPVGGPDQPFLDAIADQVAHLARRRIRVTLVSSGAVGVGFRSLGMEQRPRGVATAQAVSAVGQTGLMSAWQKAFHRHGLAAAQLLLTGQDIEDRWRYLNFRNCIHELHKLKAVPIINENDTVSVDEIRLGDNDILAAVVANALQADALILLSSVDGLLDANGRVVDAVSDVEAARALVSGGTSPLGTGGMATKLESARRVTEAGEPAIIANGREPDVLLRLMRGEKLGTCILPAEKRLAGRDRWISLAVRPTGVLIIDEGAARALLEHGKSLLATGITDLTGMFQKGDVVVIRDHRGHEIARGLVNYSADETRRIMGKRSDQFARILGRAAYQTVIHRNNLVLSTRRHSG